jgi:hypothetical protein
MITFPGVILRTGLAGASAAGIVSPRKENIASVRAEAVISRS